MSIDIIDLERRINRSDDITCYCPECHDLVTMEFDADNIWSEDMEDEIWWNCYQCPKCHETFDDSDRGNSWTKDIIDYNKHKSS